MNETNLKNGEFSCLDPDVGRLLQPFLDGELDEDRRGLFEAHLKHCARCSEELILRTDAVGQFRSNWPKYSSLMDDRAGMDPQPMSGRGLLPRFWRLCLHPVPVFVPAALTAVLALLIFFALPETTNRGGSPVWTHLAGDVSYVIPMEMRDAASPAPPCRVRPGELLNITLSFVPETGHPIRLVIEGMEGGAGRKGIPFRMIEGFPVLTVIVPDMEPGTYEAHVFSGENGELVRTFNLVVDTDTGASGS